MATSQKVTARSFTNNGDILLTLENGKKVLLNKEQIGTILLIGESVPKVGSTVLAEDSVNPVTAEVNDTWAKLSL